jgi:hypothetical protein
LKRLVEAMISHTTARPGGQEVLGKACRPRSIAGLASVDRLGMTTVADGIDNRRCRKEKTSC